MLQKTRELDEIVKYFNESKNSNKAGNRSIEEIGNLKEKVKQQEAELDDQEDRFKQLKYRCKELESVAQDGKERAKYY